MPTGYTAPVQDGTITELRPFVLRCARAFGALILMRDEAMDAPIPERFAPRTDYHDRAIEAAQDTLRELPKLTSRECDHRAQVELETALAKHVESERERDAQERRYKAMLAKVEEWKPAPECAELKTYMVKQLRESIDFDCGHRREAPTRLPGTRWRDAKLAMAERDIEYHTAERVKEIVRTERRNAWLAALRASLPA